MRILDKLTPALTAASTLYGMFSNNSDKQINQSEELMNYQYGLNLQAMKEQEASQMRMFENTGYAARVDQLKRAGLNPGLIYGAGASGGGGVTGSIAAPQVGAQQAPNQAAYTANKISIMGMGLQLAKLKSEIEVNESVAESNKAQAAMVSGAQTNKVTAEAQLTNTQVNSEVLKQEGWKLDNAFKAINVLVADETKFADIDRIKYGANEAYEKLKQSMIKTETDQATQQSIIQQYKEDVKLTIANYIKAQSETARNNQETQKLISDVSQKWMEIAQGWKGQEIDMEKIKAGLLQTFMSNEAAMKRVNADGLFGIIQSFLGGMRTIATSK